MAEPLLDFAQVGAAVQGIGSGRRAQCVRAEAAQLNTGGQRVFSQHAMVNRPVGKRPVGVPLPCRVFQWPEERTLNVVAMAGGFQVIVDPLQGQRMSGHVADFTAFTENPQMDDALAGLEVAHAQAAQFLTTQPVVKKGGQDGPVALAFKRIGRRRLKQRPGLAVAQRRRFAFVRFGFWALDPADRVVADRIDFAQVIKERGNRGELAANGAGSQAAALQVFQAIR